MHHGLAFCVISKTLQRKRLECMEGIYTVIQSVCPVLDENSFMIAGRMGDNGCYFEKDIRMDGYWLYIRAEFPQEFTPYIDILLQYVKNYGPTIVDREK